MPRRPCFWTRKLELELVEFVRHRAFIWKPFGNTNHQIQQKYRAYAEFAAKLGRGFTARSVRDRWVNIRSTFNHNVRRVEKSKETARSPEEIYVPCWPLWKPLQFLRDALKKEHNLNFEVVPTIQDDVNSLTINTHVKEEYQAELDDAQSLELRQRGRHIDYRARKTKSKRNADKCRELIDDMVKAMAPLTKNGYSNESKPYWFFGRHVTEKLNSMRVIDAQCASQEIMRLLSDWPTTKDII